MSSVDRIKEIKKEIIIVGGVGESLTGLLLGLGLYGKYFADGVHSTRCVPLTIVARKARHTSHHVHS
jgi:hypothetical protein